MDYHLEEKAAKDIAGAAQALMNLYVNDRPDDIDPEEGVEIARNGTTAGLRY